MSKVGHTIILDMRNVDMRQHHDIDMPRILVSLLILTQRTNAVPKLFNELAGDRHSDGRPPDTSPFYIQVYTTETRGKRFYPILN